MRNFAILKDSLREALDSTVLYIMLGLSAFVVLLVATVSFENLPAQTTFDKIGDGSIQVFFDVLRPEKADEHAKKRLSQNVQANLLQLDKLRVLSGAADSPDSEYVVTFQMRFSSEEEAAEARSNPADAVALIEKHFKDIVDLGLLKIASIRLATEQPNAEGRRLAFDVHTLPTSGTRRLWCARPSVFFGWLPIGEENWGVPVGFQLYVVTNTVVSIGSWVAILAGVIITSFFIPNMLRKGTVDLLLVKPIHRWALLLYKYVGGLTFVFLNIAFAIFGIWLVLGLRTGVWAHTCLLLIPVLTFFFGIMYSISTLVSVLTRSAVASILISCGAWFGFFLVGTVHRLFQDQIRVEETRNIPMEKRKWTDNPIGNVASALHAVLPRTSDLNHLSSRMLYSDFMTGSLSEANKIDLRPVDWNESMGVSALFVVLMLGLACWRFQAKDF
ncbi:MAG: ABC transporter permease [Gemmataceae bacterium]|nr:ABC transporter permease [Gemmataceae bacterium]MCI0739098.1 ABC transporter permease [Gemmataceae bacterium]